MKRSSQTDQQRKPSDGARECRPWIPGFSRKGWTFWGGLCAVISDSILTPHGGLTQAGRRVRADPPPAGKATHAELMVADIVDPMREAVFQSVFAMVITVLIALEFNHTMLDLAERGHNIVQIRTVILIALLALVRKFIVIDVKKTDPRTLVGLAARV